MVENDPKKRLASAYYELQRKPFKPSVQLPSDNRRITNIDILQGRHSLKELMTQHVRDVLVNIFLHSSKTLLPDQPPLIDGIRFEGKTYGTGYKKAVESGRLPVVVDWKDIPKALGL